MNDIKDINEFLAGSFITLETLGDGVQEETIAGVEKGKYGPNLALKSGDKFGVNATNGKLLRKHYGRDPKYWVGIKIKLVKGESTFNDEVKPSIRIVPVSPDIPLDDEQWPLAAKKQQKIDDEVPF